MANLKRLTSFIFIFCLSTILVLSCKQQKQKTHIKTTNEITGITNIKKMEDVTQKIINLGFTPYTKHSPIRWSEIILLNIYMNDKKSATALTYLNNLYNILKKQFLNYPYIIYIGDSFGAGTFELRSASQLYLKFKYLAKPKEIQKFIKKYKNIYQYKKTETNLFGTDKHKGKKIDGLPIIISKTIYSSQLCAYYDWLNRYNSQRKKINFSFLKKLKRSFLLNGQIILWLYDDTNNGIELFKDKNKQIIYIEFGPKFKLRQLNSPANLKKIKKIILSLK